MNRAIRIGSLSIAALALTGGAYGTDVDNQDLQSRLAAAEAKIAELSGDNWLTEARADEVRGLVYDVLSDADTRASLLQGGNAGYDGGFRIGDGAGNFSLTLNGEIQAAWYYNNRDASETYGLNDENIWGFEVHRTQLHWSGHVVNPSWTYFIQTEFMYDGSFNLLDSWINYDYGNGWSVTFGQFNTPFMRETLVWNAYQLAAERSLFEAKFGLGRTQGLMWTYQDDANKFSFAYHDGAGEHNTGWVDQKQGSNSTEWAFGGRYEMLASGSWDQFSDFTSFNGGETGTLVGVAVNWQKEEYGNTQSGEDENLHLTADLSMEFGGSNLFVALAYQDNDSGVMGANDPSPWGIMAQGGMFIDDQNELFLRYEYIDCDEPNEDEVNILTFGINHYISGQQLKWTTDLGYALDGINSSLSNSGRGWLADGLDENGTDLNDGQMIIRSQLQLLF